MTHNKFWWNCKYLETDRNLGVAFCSKTNDFCNKSKCDKIKLKSQKHNQFYRERINELSEENEQFKKQIFSLKLELDTHKHPLWSTREAERVVNELKEENEQLKQSNQKLNDELQETLGYLALKSGVEKENEHIKQTIKTMMENERTELGQSVLRQLQEAIK